MAAALSENRQAFKRIFLVPRMMRDVSDMDLGLDIFGQRLSMPIFVSPAGEERRMRQLSCLLKGGRFLPLCTRGYDL